MTQDEIIDMARQAKLPYYWDEDVPCHLEQLEAFAKLVAAKERERLAQEARECGGVLTVGAILARGEE
jgi:hypothetical protein